MRRRRSLAVGVTAAILVAGPAAAQTVSAPLNVTNSQFAANEESLGMSPDGSLLAGAWNDWHFNDGCGLSFSTDGGTTWAPESFVPGLTTTTNDPSVPGLNQKFTVAGDRQSPITRSSSSSMSSARPSALRSAARSSCWQRRLTQGRSSTPTTPTAAKAWPRGAARERGHDRELQPQRQGLEWQDPGSRDDDRRYQQVLPALRADLGRLCALSGQGRSPIDIAYSDNKGANWTGPVRVSDSNNQLVHDARPSVSPNGDALMTWTNGPNEKSLTNNMATADISHDGGANWGTDATVAPIPGAYSGLPNSLYRDSTDLVDCTGDNSRL